jgi:hypothetical protein
MLRKGRNVTVYISCHDFMGKMLKTWNIRIKKWLADKTFPLISTFPLTGP